MANYYSILAKAVDALDPNTQAARGGFTNARGQQWHSLLPIRYGTFGTARWQLVLSVYQATGHAERAT
jgi:hypothetical protein